MMGQRILLLCACQQPLLHTHVVKCTNEIFAFIIYAITDGSQQLTTSKTLGTTWRASFDSEANNEICYESMISFT